MIRGPHQSDDYIDAEVSHADHQDNWDARNSLTPDPNLIATLRANHEAMTRARVRQWFGDRIAEIRGAA